MTTLNPLEEQLFQGWAKAHRLGDHNDPANTFDYKGVYKRTNGMIHPPGHINQLAAEHNAAAKTSESSSQGTPTDPAAVMVEHHKNQMEADKARRGDALKVHLAERAHAHKMEMEKMKLDHKSMEAEKDRAHTANEASLNHVVDAQKFHTTRQHSLQDTLMQRAHAVQDAKANQQNELHSKMLTEHLTRPQPIPTVSKA